MMGPDWLPRPCLSRRSDLFEICLWIRAGTSKTDLKRCSDDVPLWVRGDWEDPVRLSSTPSLFFLYTNACFSQWKEVIEAWGELSSTVVWALPAGSVSFIFLSQGGFEYKRAIVDCIISIIEENPESKESGLAHLCEFIEDCEHTVLATKILHLLGKEGPRTPSPSKYIRFIFNRVVLENEAVRAGKFSSNAQWFHIWALLEISGLKLVWVWEAIVTPQALWRASSYLHQLWRWFYPARCLNSSYHLSISTWSSCFAERKRYVSF